MKKKYILPLLFLALSAGKTFAQNDAAKGFAFAEKQTDLLLKETAEAKKIAKPGMVSPRSVEKGELVLIPSKDWCSGFFPGELWYLYQYTKNPKWLKEAKAYTANIEQEKTNGGTHDMGFKIYCSVGNGYKLTKDPHYKEVILEAAKTLATRFNPTVGCIKSWDNRKDWKFPVIIDNMMNLELLFEASKLSGDSSFYKIAVSHANTTMKNHFRDDYSSFHVIDYDPETGKVLHKQTHQGYADGSAWARGQAWGLYGYTMCYRETKNKIYLKQAENIAKFIFNNPNLPKDLVPYWDFNDPAIPKVPRDASAAAVIASALYELSMYSANGKQYKGWANTIVKNLTDNYQAKPGESKGFILLHSTGNKPANGEIDAPISYADYYYLEALLRQKGLFKY
ncbi:glycoside hydrolase family 88 protein [Mucilaginibacter boryungensis]|uniref:Glycoside hydrolase family 88 protein n=1 Tax=Mucilaginibacter boryungensis TaxID=768480 RepID=A0ABR9XC54_9SPHI|nr:glycoside hydrolase family 88 protein [Mucilaginibacter boryungensis]MBE9664732.1 glycoside hydrolase family 88 protein [Mucilaginibacter boryungensis]